MVMVSTCAEHGRAVVLTAVQLLTLLCARYPCPVSWGFGEAVVLRSGACTRDASSGGAGGRQFVAKIGRHELQNCLAYRSFACVCSGNLPSTQVGVAW